MRQCNLGFEFLESRNLMATTPWSPLAGFSGQRELEHGFVVIRPVPVASLATPVVTSQQSLGNLNQVNVDDLMRCVNHGFWIIGPNCIPPLYSRLIPTATLNAPTLVTSSSTVSQYVASADGANNATKATFNVLATGAVTITELTLVVAGNNLSAVTKVNVGGVSAAPVAGIVSLKGLNLVVPNGGSGLTFDALVSYAPVGAGGIPSATKVSIGLSEVKYWAGGITKTLTLPTPVMAPEMTLVGSKPTIVMDSVSNSTLVIGAQNQIGAFTIYAGAQGPVKINDIQFAVTSTGFSLPPTFTSVRIADDRGFTIAGSSCGAGPAANASQVFFCEIGTPGNTLVGPIGTSGLESNTDFDGWTIQAGTSRTFRVYATITGASTPGALTSISTSLVSKGFNWDDTSSATYVADGTPASPANGTNLSGSLIYNFPTTSYVIHN